MTDRYAVVGNPIAHSKSPRIHAMFAKQTGADLVYTSILGEVGRFAETAEAFRAAGGRGLNVTVPFKQDAWVYADRLSDRGELAGAVNTLSFTAQGIIGDNTDGVGLVRDLEVNHGCTLAGRRILLLGAGGAARGVLQPLLLAGPGAVTIANRTFDRAAELAVRFGGFGYITASTYHELAGEHFDVVINATAAGLDDSVPPLPDTVLADNAWCYDLMYADQPTAFVRWARARGAGHALDGLGMLVEQAAESFFIWRGVRPDTASVMRALRATH